VDASSHPSVFISLYNGRSGIKLVRPLSTVDNTRGYARVSHSRQWSNYNLSDILGQAARPKLVKHYFTVSQKRDMQCIFTK